MFDQPKSIEDWKGRVWPSELRGGAPPLRGHVEFSVFQCPPHVKGVNRGDRVRIENSESGILVTVNGVERIDLVKEFTRHQ